MILNDFGDIIDYHWEIIPSRFQNVELDEYIVMPNHFHGVLWLLVNDMVPYLVGAKHSGQPISSKQDDGGRNASPLRRPDPIFSKKNDIARNASPLHDHPPTSSNPESNDPNRPKGTKSGSLSAIIQNFTSITSRKINRIRKTPGAKLWQRNYYDHIIRNDKELFNIRQYIINNPAKWELDRENPNNRKPDS